jgi:hypothetical protein
MLVVRLMCMPIATNENIVTDRTTDGDIPAKIANPQRLTKTMLIRIQEYFFVWGRGLSRKLMNNRIKPTCSPETDRI